VLRKGKFSSDYFESALEIPIKSKFPKRMTKTWEGFPKCLVPAKAEELYCRM
jgi:hypothetical protein